MLDLKEVQDLYDSGMSIRDLCKHYNVPHSQFSKKIKTRTKNDAAKLFKPSHSSDGLKRLSLAAKKRKLGGYRPHPNKGQRYKGIWLDSKWEVSVAISLDENDVKWERPSIGFVWNDAGNKYYPDFYLPEYEIYLDPKNPYLTKQHAHKIDSAMRINNIVVLVLDEHHLTWDKIYALVV